MQGEEHAHRVTDPMQSDDTYAHCLDDLDIICVWQ